ncbi:MAG: hypothetical protein Q9159_006793 [Coniocarpon cinnabarinum]
MTPARLNWHLARYARAFSTSRRALNYADTIQTLRIGPDTRVIYQGFTGRVSTSNAQQSLDYGTKVVGGTTPGKEGEHLGLPLLPSVQKAADQLKPDASAVFVSAAQAAKAIEDAIAAEIPLIVAVAEFIPLHDMLRIASILSTQSKSRLVGANSPGIISPLGRCRIGFQPLPCYLPGHIGLVAKSGTLSYETVGALTRAGLGQSLCIGMGGDIVAGTNFVEALTFFEQDPDTEAIILVGEVGGRAEQDAAAWIKEYNSRSSNPKPIAACVGGLKAPAGRVLGHAGAFASLGEAPAEVKHQALKDAGVTMVAHPTHFPAALSERLSRSGRDPAKMAAGMHQKRGYHTSGQRPRRNSKISMMKLWLSSGQSRPLHLGGAHAKKLLEDRGVPTSSTDGLEADKRYLAISVDRSHRCPVIIASPTAQEGQIFQRSRDFQYDYVQEPTEATIKGVFEHLHMDAAPPLAMASTGKLLRALADIFKQREAYALSTCISGTPDGNIAVERAEFGFDDSAYKSCKRQPDIFALRDTTKEDAETVEAEKDGIVYYKLEDAMANIGTLINGAGLGMNAMDALSEYGARPTNFLDTGGKATSATIKKCFELLLKDDRVKVIFVNIFGGLTLCDMIAEGIMISFQDLKMKVPVVVRLRGTNEEAGQKMGFFSGGRSPPASDSDSSPTNEKSAIDTFEPPEGAKTRKMSRIDAPRSGSIVSANLGADGSEASVSVGKQVELEADNAIKYRTCSWQKVRLDVPSLLPCVISDILKLQ